VLVIAARPVPHFQAGTSLPSSASLPATPPPARPRVLVIAEAANPEWVSVPLVGWSLATALREVAEVHLVTQVRNRAAIERAGLVEGTDFTAIDSEAVARPLHRVSALVRRGTGKAWTFATAIAAVSYPYFEHLAWRRFGPRIAAGEWDIVHRVTPLSPTIASPMARRIAVAGVPFVLGPLNGGVPWPPGFEVERRAEREWLSYVRGAYRLNPFRGSTLASAAAILAGSRHTASEIPAALRERVIWLPENAIDPARFTSVSEQARTGPLRACFIGRLVPYKGPDMAIEAAAPLLASGRMSLDIIGDGPMRPALEAQAARLGVTGAVTFHGTLPHRQVQDVAARSHLMVFPSIREFGGGVVLEAMAMGVVPLVVDYAGPGELVTPDTAFAVPVGPRAQIVAAVRARLEALDADRSALPAMAAAGRARIARGFTWPAKAAQVAQVYAWVLGRGPRPDFAQL
jgi:glycosyltransferase involved in cell wall biosynthesis